MCAHVPLHDNHDNALQANYNLKAQSATDSWHELSSSYCTAHLTIYGYFTSHISQPHYRCQFLTPTHSPQQCVIPIHGKSYLLWYHFLNTCPPPPYDFPSGKVVVWAVSCVKTPLLSGLLEIVIKVFAIFHELKTSTAHTVWFVSIVLKAQHINLALNIWCLLLQCTSPNTTTLDPWNWSNLQT